MTLFYVLLYNCGAKNTKLWDDG